MPRNKVPMPTVYWQARIDQVEAMLDDVAAATDFRGKLEWCSSLRRYLDWLQARLKLAEARQ